MIMKKRDLSDATKVKLLLSAADVLRMHGSLAGDRICQDWSGSKAENPSLIFSDSERDDIEHNHQIDNSSLSDYEPGYDGFHDEMAVSYTLADALCDLAAEYS
jgi:hypothetical protein